MGLLKRFGYYLIGLALGSVAVLYFWKNKNVSFDYGMDARTLKTIRIKKRVYSKEAIKFMRLNKLDSSHINSILKRGDVDFGKSKPRLKPCAEYYVTGNDSLASISLYIIRCDSLATVEKITRIN